MDMPVELKNAPASKEGPKLWASGEWYQHHPKASPVNYGGMNHYEGTKILPDGRIIESYLSHGWIYRYWVWDSEEAWKEYEGSWDRHDPEQVHGRRA